MQSNGIMLNFHDHDHDHDRDENQTLNSILKVGSAIIIFLMSFGFGALPYFW